MRPILGGVTSKPTEWNRETMNHIPHIMRCFDRRIFVWFIVLIFFKSGPLNAGEPAGPAALAEDGHLLENGWHFVTERQRIRVYNRPWPGSPIPEALARAVFHVPPERLYAVITDYDHFAEFIPYVTSSRILRHEGETGYVHQHLRFPGPVADRYYTISSSAASSRPRNNFFRVEWHLVPKSSVVVPAEEGIVPPAFSGFWELTSSANGTATEAVYSIHLDPGGALPSWLVTPMMNRYLSQVVEAVRTKVTPPATGDKREPGDRDSRDMNRR